MLVSSSDTETPLKPNSKWKQFGITIAGGNDVGKRLNQICFPQAITIDDDQTIYIVDWWNDRIVEWKSQANIGRIVTNGCRQDRQISYFDRPTDVILDKENHSLIICDCENRRIIRSFLRNNNHDEVLISDIDCLNLAMDRDGSLYVSDCVKNEIRRWKRGEQNGELVAGGNGKGDKLNQLDYPTFMYIDEDYSLYISDMNNHRVMKWLKDAEEGIVVAGGNGNGNHQNQLSYPEGLTVDRWGQIYVVDSLNHRLIRSNQELQQTTIILGGNGQGNQIHQLNSPVDLSFDHLGNLYVADCWNHRIQKFEIDLDETDSL